MQRLGQRIAWALALVATLGMTHSFSFLQNEASFSYTIEQARASQNSNLVAGATVSDNLRDANANGMSYSDGTYTMTYTGNWLRSLTVLESGFLGCSQVLLDKTGVDCRDLTVYSSATLRWESAQDHRCLGLVFGRIALNDETVYLSCNLAPKSNYLGFYFYTSASGKNDVTYQIPLTASLVSGKDYQFELLKSPTGLSVFLDGASLGSFSSYSVTQGGKSYDIDLTKAYPDAGVNFMDIDATVSQLVYKYVNPGVYEEYADIPANLVAARASTNPNLLSYADYSFSGNKRDLNDNGLVLDQGVCTLSYTGGWLRSTRLFTNDYLDSESLVDQDGKEVDTKTSDVYYKSVFSFSNAQSDRILGLVVGKMEMLEQTIFLSVNLSPKSNYACLYFSTKNSFDYSYQISLSLNLKENTDYVFEIVKDSSHLFAFLGGKQLFDISEYDVSALFHPDMSTHIQISDLIPCFGVNSMDIAATMSHFEMKYLLPYQKIKIFVEPTYPTSSPVTSFNSSEVNLSISTATQGGNADVLIVLGSVLLSLACGGAAAFVILALAKRRKKQ